MKKLLLVMIAAVAATSVWAKTGKEVYDSTCIACHGKDGKGAVPGAANFTDPKGVLTKSDDELLKHIINGFQSPGSPMAMPPKGGNPTITDEEAKEALKYVRETFGEKKK